MNDLDLETSPACTPLRHPFTNEWLRQDDPIGNWFVVPAKAEGSFIESIKPARWSSRKIGRYKFVGRSFSSKVKGSARDLQAVGKAESLEDRFASLVSAWREETQNLSSLTQILSHRAYQSIIDLGRRGEPVVPLILRDLDKNRGYWAMALQMITGENPVPPKHVGNPAKIREDWIKWGRRKGHV
jgi:hypothetical protein